MSSDETRRLIRPNWNSCLESVSVGIFRPQCRRKEEFDE